MMYLCSVLRLYYQVKSHNLSVYVLILTSLQGINVKKQTWGFTGIQTPLHTETEVCDLWFWVLFNPLRLRRFCSGTWLWSSVPVASDQTENRTPPFFLTDLLWCLASLISLLRVSSIQRPWEQNGLLLLRFHRCGVSLKYLRVSLRYSAASLWWDQAMFGHECGFRRGDANEGEWKLTE